MLALDKLCFAGKFYCLYCVSTSFKRSGYCLFMVLLLVVHHNWSLSDVHEAQWCTWTWLMFINGFYGSWKLKAESWKLKEKLDRHYFAFFKQVVWKWTLLFRANCWKHFFTAHHALLRDRASANLETWSLSTSSTCLSENRFLSFISDFPSNHTPSFQ